MVDIDKLEQRKQAALDKAARLQKQIEKQLSGQKFVLGGMLMKIAEHEPNRIPQILADIDKHVTRKSDITRLQAFQNDLVKNLPEEILDNPDESINELRRLIKNITDENSPIDDDIPF